MKRFRRRLGIMRKNCTFAKEQIYAPLGQRWSVNPFIFAWRTRFLSIRLFTNMGLWLARNPIDYGIEMEDSIRKWRETSTVGNVVTRNAIVLAVTRDHFTTADVEVACGNLAKRTAIKKLLTEGVKMDLLKRDNDWRYRPTNKLILTSFWRTMVKLLDPNVVEFCRYVVMFDDMRLVAGRVGELEAASTYRGNFKSIHEQLFYGVFDDELYADGYYDQEDDYIYDGKEDDETSKR